MTRTLPLLALLFLPALAACNERAELPHGVYAAEHDATQTVTVHPHRRIGFDQMISGPSGGWTSERRVGGGAFTYRYELEKDGGIRFFVSSNSVAGLDLVAYGWRFDGRAITRTEPESGKTVRFVRSEQTRTVTLSAP